MAETRLARHAGTVALTSTVRRASSADSAIASGSTVMAVRPVSAKTSWSMSIPMPSPAMLNTTKVPASPIARPAGMPMAASMRASAYTLRRSWRLLAPREESRPNWRVRSDTAMANEL